MIKLLIISSLLLNHSDTLIKQCTIDSCKKAFIRNLAVHYDWSFAGVTIDSCGKTWNEAIPLATFYNYYIKEMKMNFEDYKNATTDVLFYDTRSFNRCKDSLIRGWKVDKQKLKKIEQMPIEKVLKVCFDERRYMKKEYMNYEPEIMYYCYKKLISVEDRFSSPPYYVLNKRT